MKQQMTVAQFRNFEGHVFTAWFNGREITQWQFVPDGLRVWFEDDGSGEVVAPNAMIEVQPVSGDDESSDDDQPPAPASDDDTLIGVEAVMLYLKDMECVAPDEDRGELKLTPHGRDVAHKLIRERLDIFLEYRKHEIACHPDTAKMRVLSNYVLQALSMDRSDVLEVLKPRRPVLWRGKTPGEALAW